MNVYHIVHWPRKTFKTFQDLGIKSLKIGLDILRGCIMQIVLIVEKKMNEKSTKYSWELGV